MPLDMLQAAGPNVTGQWIRTEPPAKKTWPFRVQLIDLGGAANPLWTAGNVILEELADGLPTSSGLLPGNPGMLIPGSQTGEVTTIAVLAAGSPDYIIVAPTEFIRARTDANVPVGAVTVRLHSAE